MTSGMVTLKNGEEYSRMTVASIMLNLQELAEMDPIGLSELRDLARDPGHQLWGNTEARLAERSLVTRTSGRPVVDVVIRDVVLSAVTGEDEAMTLGSPLAGEATSG